MIVPSLEVVYPTNTTIAPPGWRPQIDIICIHDLGGSPKATWHHDESGKTWISDPDFLGSFNDSVRIWAYGYNSEPVANMTPASIALHADDLLASMMNGYREYGGGPTIFIAHGLGGTIVKKAVELYTYCPEYFVIKDLAASIIFLGTVHHPTDSEGVLKAVKATVTAGLTKNSADPSMDEIRQFSETVRQVNNNFVNKTMPRFLILNCLAKRSIKVTADDGTSSRNRIVSGRCGEMNSANVKNVSLDCNHLELTQIPSPSSQVHTILTENIDEIIQIILARDKRRVIFSPPPPATLNTAGPSPPSPPDPEKLGRPSHMPKGRIIPGPPQRVTDTESFQLWARKKNAEYIGKYRDTLLNKLGTWDQTHLGHDIYPIPGTCTWIQSDPTFRDWLKSNKADCMYIFGGSGCGKTYLAKFIANYLAGDRPRPSPTYGNVVLSFFCNVSATGNKQPSILEYFIKSLLMSTLWFESLSSQFWYLQEDGEKLDLGSLFEILRQFMTRHQPTTGPPRTTEVFLIIDGLQECDVTYVRDFLHLVGSLVDSPPPRGPPPPGSVGPAQHFARETVRFKFLFTHSPNEVFSLASPRAVRIGMADADVEENISKFIDVEAKTIFKAKKLVQSPEEICSWIKGKSGSFFFFAKFFLHNFVATAEDADACEFSMTTRLIPCPELLGQYYGYELLPIFQNIDNQNYLLSILQIVINSKSSISREEIQDAIACLHDDSRLRRLDIPSVLQQKCPRLIHVDDNSELRITHQSFCSHFRTYINKEQQHANMAFLCLKYLSQPIFGRDCDDSPTELPRHHPFYNYAARWWEDHFRLSDREGTKLLSQLGHFITSPCYNTWSSHRSWNIATSQWARRTPMYNAMMSNPWIPPAITLTKANAGHLISELQDTYGMVEPKSRSWKTNASILAAKFPYRLDAFPGLNRLLENAHPKPDFSVRDAAGHTPLMTAAMAPDGLPDMVEFLLQKTQDVNERSSVHGDTALLLLCRFLDLRDDLLFGNMLSLFLAAGADPNISGLDGKTCLLEACERNSVTMVELLLRAGASPNASTIDGNTPLREALMNSNVAIVERLIAHDVDLDMNFPWPSDQTPLTFVIIERNFDLFKLLLNTLDDINQLDGAGFAAIHLLTAPEYIEWLPHLLRRPDVDLNLLSNGLEDDRTRVLRRAPLGFAIFHDNFKAVEMLLEAGANPCRCPGATDDTPVYMAVKFARTTNYKNRSVSHDLSPVAIKHDKSKLDNTGNVDILELLVSYQSPINTLLNHKSKEYAKSPLRLAVHLGDQNMVEFLLRHRADPTLEEAYGLLGPLDAAIVHGDEDTTLELVKTLLDNNLPPSINYLPEDNNQADHVLIAASELKPALVQLLLHYGADTKSFLPPSPHCNSTPLLCAVKENNVDICKVLVEHEPDLVNCQFEEGLVCEAPIHVAARERHVEIVRYLLDAGAKPDLLSYHWHETPLWSACYDGKLEIAQLLYDKSPETLETPSYNGSTPLIVACEAGNLQLVRFLLEKGADVNARLSIGESCVHSAVSKHNGAAHKVVDLLIQHGLGINDVVGAIGFTVLGEACRVGDAQTVRMLLEKGADPSKGQKPPGNTSGAWRSALHVAAIGGQTKIVEILLQSHQLASFVENVDYYGDNVLHLHSPGSLAKAYEITNKIYRACQRLESETGIDHFQAMLTVKNRDLHTPIDIALGGLHERLSDEAMANTDEIICQYVGELTAEDQRTVFHHKHLMIDLSILLLQRGGYDQQAVRLLQTLTIHVSIKELKDRLIDTVACTICCDVCDSSDCSDDDDDDDDDENEVMYFCRFCRFCRLVVCQSCVDKTERGHGLVRIPIVKDRRMLDFNSEEINRAFDILKNDFVVRQKPVFDRSASAASFEVDSNSDNTTLSLALLHAFGYLEFRRRAWSPYLPLAPVVYKRIQPWEAVIELPRRDFQEWVWHTETFPLRLRNELYYFLEAGKRMAYSDLEAIQREQVIRDVPGLFARQGGSQIDERVPARTRGQRRMKEFDSH
ncbi:ankyrin repeat-containing domain protein [Colletotrichum navitas]|uniref:Ankyrin repeat-containing domain protein n=1 Tax=Colletotrichum navitas TaxID=681940 RepID=A0AAD8UZY8_9PEZI|nr:ankyrin repeat-containing domain protein [Colletotrichum navitas]KAK1574197.1 ankyrin repeat-containing domain protein [Colletotrichum navitas]